MRLGLGLGLGTSQRSRVLAAFDFTTAAISGGLFTLPPWLAIACATTGRTSQTGPATLRTGFGANAPRARSVDGSAWGLSVESARTNLCLRSSELSNSGVWGANAGVTISADTTDVADPAGANLADKIAYTTGGGAGGYRFVQNVLSPSGNGVSYTATLWARLLSGSTTFRYTQNLATLFAEMTASGAWSRWERNNAGDGSSTLQQAMYADAATDAAFALYGYGAQTEVGKYPSSLVPTAGATVARAADVHSIPSPALIAPGGFFDATMVVAPNYAHAEHGVDHDLINFGTVRAYLNASDHKVYLHTGGLDVASSALTWSRDQALSLRLVHARSGRRIEVSGATTGNGITTGGADASFSLPGTAYLIGSSSGAQECADLRFVQFRAA